MMVDITCIHALRNMHPDELQSTTDACRAIKDASILWQLSYEARPCMPSQHTMFTAKLSYKARTSMPSQQRNATQRGYTKQWRRTDDATTKLKLKGTVQLSTNTVPRFHDRSWILVFSSICCRFVSRCFSMFLNLFYVSRFCHFFSFFLGTSRISENHKKPSFSTAGGAPDFISILPDGGVHWITGVPILFWHLAPGPFGDPVFDPKPTKLEVRLLLPFCKRKKVVSGGPRRVSTQKKS